MNFSKPAAGEPTLLSFDDARTLFHEFGHALHGMLSDVTYPLISGTAVPSDFVELPSQLYEHWLERAGDPAARIARHIRTGEPMPKALLDQLLAARTFNQGFATVEYIASALVDLDFHSLPDAPSLDVVGVRDARRLQRIGMPDGDRDAPPPAAFQPCVLRRRLCGRLLLATCGRKCSTPMPSPPSRRPATRSTRRRPSGCASYVYSAGNLRDPPRPTRRSAAACRRRTRC